MWRAERREDGFAVAEPPRTTEHLAVIGARSCDLHAIAIQDRVLRGGPYPDPGYAARRDNPFVVAVNCGTKIRRAGTR